MIKAYCLPTKEVVIAEETDEGNWFYPMYVEPRVLPNNQVAMDFKPMNEFFKNESFKFNKDIILVEDEASEKIQNAYKQIVQQYRSRKSNIVIPKPGMIKK